MHVQIPFSLHARTISLFNKILLLIEAVLAQDYICVVGNSDKIEEGKELFGEVKDLLV